MSKVFKFPRAPWFRMAFSRRFDFAYKRLVNEAALKLGWILIRWRRHYLADVVAHQAYKQGWDESLAKTGTTLTVMRRQLEMSQQAVPASVFLYDGESSRMVIRLRSGRFALVHLSQALPELGSKKSYGTVEDLVKAELQRYKSQNQGKQLQVMDVRPKAGK